MAQPLDNNPLKRLNSEITGEERETKRPKEDIEIRVDEKREAIASDLSPSSDKGINEDYSFQMTEGNPGKEQDIFEGTLTPSSRNSNNNHSNNHNGLFVSHPFFPPFLNLPFSPLPPFLNLPRKMPIYKGAEGKDLFQMIKDNPGKEQEIFSDRILKTFSFKGIEVALPPSLWNVHSPIFESILKECETEDIYLVEENAPQESIQLFAQALKTCSSSEILTLKNLKNETLFDELRLLAHKYDVAWLINDCNQYAKFFNVYNYVKKEACFKNSEGVSLAIIRLLNEDIKVNPSDKEALIQIAVENQLVDLHLYCLCKMRLLPNNYLCVDSWKKDDFALCIDKKNSWHLPNKIVLNLGDDVGDIPLITKTSVPIIFWLFCSNKFPENLNNLLTENPKIEHLRVELVEDEPNLETILKFVKENTTLKSLHIAFGRNTGLTDDHFREASDANQTLEKFTVVIPTTQCLDYDSTFGNWPHEATDDTTFDVYGFK